MNLKLWDTDHKLSDTGRICLNKFLRSGRGSRFKNDFSRILVCSDMWGSSKCDLVWNLKGRMNRLYFQLQPIIEIDEEINDEIRFLPTPNAMDGARGINANTTKYESGRFVRTSETTGTRYGASLGMAAMTGMLPTPTKSDYQVRYKTDNWKGNDLPSTINDIMGSKLNLNPPFVLEMMGFPADWTLKPNIKNKK